MTKTAPRNDAAAPARAGAHIRRMSFDPGNVAFGRHESFPLRFGWIAKGLDALRADPLVFTREDATIVLGVGRNMVSSIRHWLQAAGLARPLPDGRGFEETELARTAFGPEGDPYLGASPSGDAIENAGAFSHRRQNMQPVSQHPALSRHLEDAGTIWLLHWLLATDPAAATAVYWFFNRFHKPAFANDEAAAGLRAFADGEAATRTSPATLSRDAATILRMYTRPAASTRLALDAPLSLLDLVDLVDLVDRVDAQRRRSVPAPRPGLPPGIFAFAVAEAFQHLDTPQVAPIGMVIRFSRTPESTVPRVRLRAEDRLLAGLRPSKEHGRHTRKRSAT